MNCATARHMILEADLAEFDGTIDSELMEHVRACADCAAAVQRILTAERELREALRGAAPRRAADEAIRRARAPRRHWAWRAAPVAVAAVLAALLLGRRPLVDHALPPPPPPPPPLPQPLEPHLAVEAPPGRSVAVFGTDNPDIVIIWFY
ncbi:MAG TPA: hypothetical protein VGQ25_07565 [Gemmatimonadales bacterium]|jgi:hypothetical protein|nr:hypothetical protein [Gemmatimonadales bacterium]